MFYLPRRHPCSWDLCFAEGGYSQPKERGPSFEDAESKVCPQYRHCSVLTALSNIRSAAESQWAAIPTYLKLDGPLSSCNQRHVEIDFLVSARLNFAHVKFLLELTITPRISSPGIELLRTSADMFSLVVEAIILRQRLANSGTSLVWKVSMCWYFCYFPVFMGVLMKLCTFDKLSFCLPYLLHSFLHQSILKKGYNCSDCC